MKNKKHIAMRCTKEQFKSIKPKLEGKVNFYSVSVGNFQQYNYLVNCDQGMISNVSKSGFKHVWENVEEIHEQWNEKIFLEACGIETIPTLEEVKEYFKDAETIKTLSNVLKISKDTFHLYEKDYWYTDENGYHGIVWNKEIGYAKILTYKTQKFEITKEQILELIKDGHPSSIAIAREWFPEVFEVKLEVGKWYKGEKNILLHVTDFENINSINGYGFTKDGSWEGSRGKNEWGLSMRCVEATPEEVTEALKKEAVSLGLVVGNYALFGEIKEARRISEEIIWNERHNCLCSGQNVLMNSSGKWATVIQTKTIQQAEELLKELGHEIKIV